MRRTLFPGSLARGRLLLALVLLFPACGLLPACGGGGGGEGLAPGEPGPPTPTTPQTRIKGILEACVLEGVRAFETAVSRFEPVLDGGGAASPGFQVTGVDLLGASLTWTLDADVDGASDLAGTIRFLDAAGAPSWPWTPLTVLALLAGTADLPSLFATLPDGTTVAADYATVGFPVPVSGSLDTTFAGGQPSTASGDAQLDGTSCGIAIAFSDLPAAPLLDPTPTGAFDLLATTADGVLQGTLALNGDGTATIDVALDAADRAVWDYDLATGTLTPRP